MDRDNSKKIIGASTLFMESGSYLVRKVVVASVLLAAAAVALIVLSGSGQFLQASVHDAFSSTTVPLSTEMIELKRVLQNVSRADKTVIITTLNEAWAAPKSMFDVFRESFKRGNQTEGLLEHLLVVTSDEKAHDNCRKVHPHCYALKTEGTDFSGEAFFMSEEYLKIVWRKILFLQNVLDLGYNFLFTDADIMWFRDPFTHFHQDADFQVACDFFLGNPSDLNNAPNTGFSYTVSNDKTRQFYKFWYESRTLYPKQHDQDVLNKIKHHPFLKDIGLQIRFLDTKYFGGFCQKSEDFDLVCTMHANCCFGLDNKVQDLRMMLDDWSKYVEYSKNTSHDPPHKSAWSVPQHCRW